MSSIDTSGINRNFPIRAKDNPSQGFRDNFNSIAEQLDVAATEIAVLQSDVEAISFVITTSTDGIVFNNGIVVNGSASLDNSPIINLATLTNASAAGLIGSTGGVTVQTQLDTYSGVTVSNFTSLSISTQTNKIDVSGALSPGVGIATWIKDTDQTSTEIKTWRKRVGTNGPYFIIPPNILNIDQMGADPTGVNDSLPIFLEAIDYSTRSRVLGGRQRNIPIQLGRGIYRTTGEIVITGQDGIFFGPGAQLCSIINESTTGNVIKYTGTGDFRFQGFSIDASGDRLNASQAAADLLLDGFASDPGTTNSTIRLTMRDIYVSNQPGNGITLVQPEGARLENIVCNNNKRNGCYIWGRDLENIENYIDFARFRNNGIRGLDVNFMSVNLFNRVECLNNADPIQFRLFGYNNIINQPDCEAFDIVTTSTSYIGLRIEGNGNILNGGTFYAVNEAIRLSSSAKQTIINNPKIQGKTGVPMTTGINITNGCLNNQISTFNTFTNVITPFLDSGTGTQDNLSGVQRLNKYALKIPSMTTVSTDSTQILDLSSQSVFWFNLKNYATFQATNLTPGFKFTLIVQIDSAPSASRGFTFNSQFKQGVTGNGSGVPSTSTCSIMEFIVMDTSTIRQISQSPWYLIT